MTHRRLISGFLILIATLTLGHYLLPAARPLWWAAIGVTSAAAVALGIIRYRPRRPTGWWLIMAALLVLTAVELANITQVRLVDRTVLPAVSDVVYLGLFAPLLIVGVWRLVRTGARGTDRALLLETVAIATAAAVVAWAFLISPLVIGNTYSVIEKAVAVGYTVSGVLVLAAIVRLTGAVRVTSALVLPVIGVLGMIGAGVAYGLLQLEPTWRVGGPVLLGWVVLAAGWGAGALHPAMAEFTAPRTVRPRELSPTRLVALALAVLLAPLALLVEATRGMPADITVRRALIVALFVVVLARLGSAVASQVRGLQRERALRRAGTALVEATTTDQVVAVVRRAVTQLLPPGAVHQVVVEVGGTVLPADSTAPAAATALGRAPPPETSATSIHPLDPGLASQPGLPGAVLRGELVLARPAGDGHLGALYVAADEPLLVQLRAAVEVIAAQAALALERIRLTDEINRRANEEYFRTLVQNAADVILIVDDDLTVRYASPSAATVLGVARPGRLPDLIPAPEWTAVERSLQALGGDPDAPVTADWQLQAADGRHLHAEVTLRDLRTDRTVAGTVVTLRDVTEQRRLQRQLTHLAFHDPLTGLANRVLLQERVERALARAARDQTIVGMLVLDVDDLKAVNDTLGHAAGDELLIATARRLSSALRYQDTAARLGGDEFAALIVGAGSPQEVESVAQRVVAAFVEPFTIAGQVISRAVSVGAATTVEADSGEALLRQADLALYVAKSAGKAQWRRYGAAPPDPAHAVPYRPLPTPDPAPASAPDLTLDPEPGTGPEVGAAGPAPLGGSWIWQPPPGDTPRCLPGPLTTDGQSWAGPVALPPHR